MKTALVVAMAALLLSGCASRFNDAMEGSVKMTQNASQVIDSAQRDVIRMVAVQALPLKQELTSKGVAVPDFVWLACTKGSRRLRYTSEAIATFSDSTDLVAKVAKKPDDTSFAGYIVQIGDDRKAAEDAKNTPAASTPMAPFKANDPKDIQESADISTCEEKFLADLAPSTQLTRPQEQQGLIPAPPYSLYTESFSLDVDSFTGAFGLMTEVLGQIENLAREDAVRTTILHTIPRMHDAQLRLSMSPSQYPWATVQYAVDAPKLVLDENATYLGAAITLERWYVGKKIEAIWQHVQKCTQKIACIGEPGVRADLDDLVDAMYLYRSVSELNSTKILADLDTAIGAAQKSTTLDGKAMLSAFSGVAGSISSLSDAYGKYQKSKN